MKRKTFLSTIAMVPLMGASHSLQSLSSAVGNLASTSPMPALFLGHGSPMNAIEENEFVQGFRNVSKSIALPTAIVCISAHWETKGTFVTAMQSPRTIHDFGGFPKELYQVQYPAPGSPTLATEVQKELGDDRVGLDEAWGLDHGAWSVLKHLYPDASVPVIQLSLDYSQPPSYHYNLAKELNFLRKKGVLVVGSGNMVHNLRMVAWDKMHDDDYAYDWAAEASSKMQTLIINRDHQALVNYTSLGKAFALAVPTPEHFLPLLYILALQGETENASIFNNKAVAGSITMTSIQVG